jgi:alpha-beta hydrolase superfamily lysophospholipase
MKKKKIIRWIQYILIVYGLIGIALYYLQNKFLFHPVKLSRDHVFQFEERFEEVFIPFNETDTINMIKFFPKDSLRRGVVIYFHGNKQNVERYAKFADNFTRHGYEVWMEDYPGFGKSVGERNEQKLYEQALQLARMAASRYRQDSIIIYGKSFGTGIAAYTAANTTCKRLILESPYYSIPALFSCYAPIYPTSTMCEYKIPTHEYLEDTKCPITIFHGYDDEVIPFRCAKRLKSSFKITDEFIKIDKGDHHNLNDKPQFRNKLDSLLAL